MLNKLVMINLYLFFHTMNHFHWLWFINWLLRCLNHLAPGISNLSIILSFFWCFENLTFCVSKICTSSYSLFLLSFCLFMDLFLSLEHLFIWDCTQLNALIGDIDHIAVLKGTCSTCEDIGISSINLLFISLIFAYFNLGLIYT